MTHQPPDVDIPRPAIRDDEYPIHPHIIEALQADCAWIFFYPNSSNATPCKDFSRTPFIQKFST
jgi:hypothetical protein